MNENSLPTPSVLLTSIRPPCASHDGLTEGETEPEAVGPELEIPRRMLVDVLHLVDLVEDPRQLAGRDADPGVTQRQPQAVVLGADGRP